MAPVRTVNSFDLYIRKSVESILSLVPRHKGLRIALIVFKKSILHRLLRIQLEMSIFAPLNKMNYGKENTLHCTC